MPDQVDFRRLVTNILNAMEIKKDQDYESESKKASKNFIQRSKGNKYEKWKNYLELRENQAIISDSFWYYICVYKKMRVSSHTLTHTTFVRFTRMIASR